MKDYHNHDDLRKLFEYAVKNAKSLKNNTPLGIMEVEGVFQGYFDPDTDTLFIGFVMGFNMSKPENLSKYEEDTNENKG